MKRFVQERTELPSLCIFPSFHRTGLDRGGVAYKRRGTHHVRLEEEIEKDEVERIGVFVLVLVCVWRVVYS